jgi:hypothetical protein
MSDTEQPAGGDQADVETTVAGTAAAPVVQVVALARSRAWSVLTSFVAAFVVSLLALVYVYQSDQKIERLVAQYAADQRANDRAWCTLLALIDPGPGAPPPADPRQQAIIEAVRSISRQFGCPGTTR